MYKLVNMLAHGELVVCLQDFGNLDMVIEAVFENLELKHRIIQEVENVSL